MIKEYYENRDEVILGFSAHIIYMANKHTDSYLDGADSDKGKWLEFYSEYLSLFIQTAIRKAENKLAKKASEHLIDRIFILTTWLATEARGFFMNKELKTALLDEIRRMCADRIEYYLTLPVNDLETKDDKKNSVLWNFANKISIIDGSHPNLGAILGHQTVAANSLTQINYDQFVEYYQLT